MDKITHQVRAEHWAKIMTQNALLPATAGHRIRKWRQWCQRLKGRSLLLRSSFHLLLKAQLRFFIRIS